MGKMIYLDNAATTKTAPEVVQAMLPYFSEYYGNPSSIYDFAGKSKEAITKGREQIAEVLGAKKEEKPAGGVENAISQIVTAEEESDETDDLELVAVITAAIAASEGTSSDGLVVRSIKRRF